jgi:hypothetical protein
MAEDRLFGMSVIRKETEMKYFVRSLLWIASGSVYTSGVCPDVDEKGASKFGGKTNCEYVIAKNY